jgi:hypothetical protein
MLYFDGNRGKESKFLDKDFGEFIGIYRSVLGGGRTHPERNKLNIKLSAQRNNSLEKRKRTNLKRYGAENAMQVDTLKEKHRATLKENYGVDFFWQSPELRERAEKTLRKNYGIIFGEYNSEISKKMKQTCLENYGVDNPMYNLDIKNKNKLESKMVILNYMMGCPRLTTLN